MGNTGIIVCNTANYFGGGICIQSDTTLIATNSTITYNLAMDSAGGIYNGDNGKLQLINSIVATNYSVNTMDIQGNMGNTRLRPKTPFIISSAIVSISG